MFTVKIMNLNPETQSLESVYLREWADVEVWYPGSKNFIDKCEDLAQGVFNDYHNDLEGESKTGDELQALIDLQYTYICFITYSTSDGGGSYYCVAPNEEVYITNSDGKTVHVIK